MLDEQILQLATKTVAPEIKDMERLFEEQIGKLKAKLHGQGALYLYLCQEYENEIRRRAAGVWRSLHRAHGSFGAPQAETLQDDLLQAFRQTMDAIVADLAPRFQWDMKNCPASANLMGKLGDARDQEFARHDAEIEHYVASLKAATARGAPSGGGYNFYGTVGAVLTGQGAIANVVQNIDAAQQKAVAEALDLVRKALESAPEVHQSDKREFLELADEATTEISKERPNTRRLSLILQTLAAAVQGIASGGQAYEVLRAAVAAIGIPI